MSKDLNVPSHVTYVTVTRFWKGYIANFEKENRLKVCRKVEGSQNSFHKKMREVGGW